MWRNMYMQQVTSRRFGRTVTPPGPSGPIFYMKFNSANYKLDEISASTADTALGYTGSATGGALNGYIIDGGAYRFQFNNAKSDNAMINYAGAWTIEAFMKGASVNIASNRVLIYMNGNNNVIFQFGRDGVGDGHSEVQMLIKKNGITSIDVKSAKASITAGVWYHAFASYDGTKLYLGINGTILYSSNQPSSDMPDLSSKPVDRFVKLYPLNGGYSDGLDNVVIHSTCKWSGNVSDAYTPPSAEY